MIVTGQEFNDNLQRVVSLIPRFENHVLRKHRDMAATTPKEYTFKFPFSRNDCDEFFEAVIDHILPDDFDFKSSFPVVEDQVFKGRALTRIGVQKVTFSWWNIDLATIQVEFTPSHVHQLLRKDREEQLKNAALGPSYETIVKAVEHFGIPAWGPTVAEGVAGPATTSRFSGDPWLPSEVDWPNDSVGEPMLFVAQFNLNELPKQMQEIVGDRGLISVFSARCPERDDETAERTGDDTAVYRFTLLEQGGLRKNG